MKPNEALAAIDHLDKFGMDLGLQRIEACMKVLGTPQNRFASVHVAGTNGKGSTSALIEAALRHNGVHTGLFTSPPLEFFGERIRIDGKHLPDEEVPSLYGEVIGAGERDAGAACLTQFELITAMAFLCFAREAVDIAVIEVGLGGRLDSTNVITPEVSVITNIGLEHAEHLGPTLSAIATEKGGIIKPGVPVVTAAAAEPRSVLRTLAEQNGSPFYALGEDFSADIGPGGNIRYRGLRWHWDGIGLSLKGPHQITNLATALATLEILQGRGWELKEDAIRSAVANTTWPGRLEACGECPVVLLDGAHNPQASSALAAALRNDFSYRRLWMILGVLGDKDARSILSDLAPLSDHLLFTASTSRRAIPARELRELADTFPGREYRVIEGVGSALQVALNEATPEDLICVTGSLTTVGEARSYLRTVGRVA